MGRHAGKEVSGVYDLRGDLVYDPEMNVTPPPELSHGGG